MIRTCLEILTAGPRDSRAFARVCVFGWLLLALGCSTPVTLAPKSAPAQLAITNVTDYSWRLVITAATGGEPRNVAVPPRAECTVAVDGGEYVIEQTVEASGLTRRISCRLESGQAYQWQLATLLAPGATFTP